MSKYFIAVYTHEVKDYCKEEFFDNLSNLSSKDFELHIVDNTQDMDHSMLLRQTCPVENQLTYLNIPREPHNTLFLRRVTESVNKLRDDFLDSDCNYFLIIESDLLVPLDVLEQFDKTIEQLDDNWGIVGGTYYKGFHDFTKKGIYETNHALSGCTVYKKEVIKEYPFRWSTENMGAFPDAWICYDVNLDKKYKIYNQGDILCDHLHDKTGRRGHQHV